MILLAKTTANTSIIGLSMIKSTVNLLDYAINERFEGNLIQQISHPAKELHLPINFQNEINDVLRSWQQAFTYKEEEAKYNIQGLRSPQLGAIHAVHAHWSISDETATVVMPTGTGKTETMLSVLVTKRCKRLVVIVPTDALRTQIFDKFLTLGVLKKIGVISEEALFPIVGILRHIPKTLQEVEDFFSKCQVIITTMKIMAESTPEIQDRVAHFCPYLFIDEAHHIGAPTWAKFVDKFQENRILQFTATPYRNDGKPVSGKIIFNYPLKKAQEDDYFRPINFKPVVEFDPEKSDLMIAQRAVAQLREDLQANYDHILMARVGYIKRANEVFEIYRNYPEFNPVQIHTGIKSQQEREEIRQQIVNKQTRIVVCVDMLGEGFDLPELKIAAFHDIRQSLPVTLQLAGRFTRVRSDLGDATFIANIADVHVQDELRSLYSQDSDWNMLLRRSSESLIQDQVDLWDILAGFDELSEDIPLQNIKIAMSTVVYETQCDMWNPDNFRKGIQSPDSYDWIKHDVNHQRNVLIILTAKKIPLPWIKYDDFHQWELDLYVAYWDNAQNLLFIHNSSNKGYFRKLAEAICDDSAVIVKGNTVFRSLSGINRLRLQNVGLKQERGRLVSYTMRAGSDVEPAITSAQRQRASKTNLFGVGYEGGRKVSIGRSRRGRIWARQTCNIDLFTRWCSATGSKVTDENIDPDEVLRGTIVPIPISERPDKIPITIEWPETMFIVSEISSRISIEGRSAYLHQAGLNLLNPSEEGDIAFEIRSDEISASFKLCLRQRNDVGDFFIESLDRKSVIIEHGRKAVTANEFFFENPPTIWFVDGSSLSGNEYTELTRHLDPYPESKIVRWDWTGTTIKKESQGVEKAPESIQYRVIQELLLDDYDIVFDDDDSGEAADVVTIRASDDGIDVGFYHCKFSSEEKPGARIKDLYEVCGQAQKSIRWMENVTELFNHLLRRNPRKREGEEYSRFEVGNKNDLVKIREMSRMLPVRLSVFVVQPGLSVSPSTDQLQLLSVTENHLMETYQLPFGVIGSK